MKAIRTRTKEEKKALEKEIRRQCVEICGKYELDYDTVMIYILHFYYGFGEKRIRAFHKTLLKERAELKKWYSADEGQDETDIHFFAMRQKLKDRGIDVEKISDELMAEAEAEGNA